MQNAAIGFAAEGFRTDRPKLMGRQAAGEGFLRGYVRHAGVPVVAGYLLAPQDGTAFTEQVAAIDPARRAVTIPLGAIDQLAQYGTLALPDPSLADAARLRRFTDTRRYSITGVTHTTASHGAMGMITDLLASGAEPWDALICTSAAVKGTVERLLSAEAAFLAERMGATRFPLPALPVIPLGVDTDALVPPLGARAEWRRRLGVGERDVVVLTLGRLSWHAKQHPVALLAALGRAARQPDMPRLHCVMAGWFADDSQERVHRAYAEALAPGVQLTTLDARDPAVRREIWAAADIFTLLADNIQETFGLAPVEAMAAGLPVVVSDWNGFRDTVRHGEDGLRVPTVMTAPGSAMDLAFRHAAATDNYDHYLAATTQIAAVDIAAAAEAFAALAREPSMRLRMGRQGQARARTTYDWRVVIGQYQALWAELAAMRAKAPARPARPDPRRADPSTAFAHYASATLGPDSVLAADPQGLPLAQMAGLPSALRPQAGTPSAAGLEAMLGLLAQRGEASLQDLASAMPEAERRRALRGGLWLVKNGLAKRVR
jgi:starch synthase